MSIFELLSKLEELGINLQIVDSGLKVLGPQGRLTPDLIAELRDKKQELTALLQRRTQTGKGYMAIEAAEKREYYMLSPAQKRLYFIQQMETALIAYNMPQIILLSEAVQMENLELVFKKIIARHESLRTSFLMIIEEPVQRVHDEVEFKIEYHQVEIKAQVEDGDTAPLLIEAANRSSQPAAALISSFIRPFDLSRPPLLRVGIIKTAGSENLLMIDMHHIITDGTSHSILKRECFSLSTGESRELPGLRLQYKDYSQWLNGPQQQQKVRTQGNYWLEIFAGEIPVLNLPLDLPRPEYQSFEGRTLDFTLNRDETQQLKNILRGHNITLYMALLAIFNILMAKLGGQEDIIVGTPIAARRHPDLRAIIGMFVNTLAVRMYPTGHKSLAVFLQEVKTQTLDAYENQEYPFEELVDKRLDQRDTSRGPLFDVMFNLLNQEDYRGEIPGTKPDSPPTPLYQNRTSKFDLNLTCADQGEKIFFTLEYCSKLFKEITILRMIDYFKKIAGLVSDPENSNIKISGIEIVTAKEKKLLLNEFNETTVDFPPGKTIHELFEEQKRQNPGNIALVGPIQVKYRTYKAYMAYISYHELNKRSNQLANLLRAKGVTPDTIVGLMVERSLEMITAILGILKAGGAYLPIDTQYPETRKTYILKDSGVKVILVSPGIKVEAREKSLEIIDISILFSSSTLTLASTSTCQVNHTNLAYMIYTSGSTGKPKGVLLEHRNLVNLLKWNSRYTKMDFSTVLQYATICFDISFQEIFSTLLAGGKLCLIPGKTRTDLPGLFKIIKKQDIKTLFLPMAVLEAIFSEEDYIGIFPLCVAHIQTAGEQVVVSQRFRSYLQENNIHLHNHYGPSETHVVTALTLSPVGEIPARPHIGKPVSNTKIYILDQYNNVQPIGVPGELYIGGIQVGRGYLNQPELTNEKFINCKHNCLYRSYRSHMSYIYRSGDLARWQPEGNIEFLGRIDTQVKIQGFRIELGEIESLLLNHENVKGAVVLAKGGESRDKYLCAYLVPRHPREEMDLKEIKDYLAAQLPRYMVPDYFVVLEQIPLTPNGKIHRTKLLSYKETRPGLSDSSSAPSTAMEKKVAGIWRQVLKSEVVGLDDNFFEIGGNSITILKIHGKLKKELEIDTPVVKLFKYPTIRSLAQYLAEEQEDNPPPDRKLKLDREITAGKDRRKQRVRDREPGTGLEIAVIGMSGVFPGAGNLEEFWENLKNGIESIVFFNSDELEKTGISKLLLEDPNFVKAKGVLEGEEYFEASFFGYTPREAQMMDPQVRVFHQCVWHALEDAGYDPFAYPGRIGLYAGSSPNIFWEALTLLTSGSHSLVGLQSLLLRDKDFLCSRISYKLSLKGPSFSVQTACSTSLVAIHLAAQALLDGECEMAAAGGVTVTYPTKTGHLYQEDMINSPDGHCRAFDVKSAGIVEGNGAGVVVLKPLREAAAEKDHIYAVIKGSAINNDGDRKVGYTAPSVEGQAEVIRAAQYMAGIEPETITYVETHGTGTALGDPVEIEALKLAFNTDKKGFCGIGSVKTNIGHTDCAAGAASFIKTVLALKHRLIPPTLHFNTPNPKLGLADSPFYVVPGLKEWHTNGGPRRAGVSSLGIGGTNAHVILEECSEGTRGLAPLSNRQYQLILLSARTPTTLDKISQNLTEYFKKNLLNPGNRENPINPGPTLADAVYTLQVGRKSHPYRKILLCRTTAETAASLSTSSTKLKTVLTRPAPPPVIFVLAGLGSHYVNMGWGLYQEESLFREEIDRCAGKLTPLIGYDIKEILYPGMSVSEVSAERSPDSNQINRSHRSNTSPINQTEVTQLVIFIFEYALAKLFMKWGIHPRAMIGYSLGEFVAACLSGVFSLEDALKLVIARAWLIREKTPPAAMLSVPLPIKEIKPGLDRRANIWLAVENGPSFVAAGTAAAVDEFETEMKTKRLLCTRVNNPQAIHTPLMEPIRAAFENKIREVQRNKPQIPYISNVSGNWIAAAQAANPVYWGNHLCSPVWFSRGVKCLLKEENAVFIEIGAGRLLNNLIRQLAAETPGHGHGFINPVRHQQEKVPDDYLLLKEIGKLWLNNVEPDWQAFHAGEERHRISLPTYPFEGKRYWINERVFKNLIRQQGQFQEESRELPGEQQEEALVAEAPLTPNAALEDYEKNEENHQDPRDELERNIARVWQKLLGFERISIYDDFFRLSGDSLTATQLIAHIKDLYPVEIRMEDFFEEPTIAHLAEIIKKLLVKKIKSLSPEEKKRLAQQLVVNP